MKVLICTGIAGLRVRAELVRQLFARDRKFFDGFPADFWYGEQTSWCKTKEEFQRLHPKTIVTEDEVFFLKGDVEFRTDPWVIAQAESSLDNIAETMHQRGLKVVEVPDDVKWHIFYDDDGSETIHEEHRVFS